MKLSIRDMILGLGKDPWNSGLSSVLCLFLQACGDAKSKPSFLSDKSLESSIKHIVRRFPNVDIKGSSAQLTPVLNIKQEIVKSLSLYYYTFVDLLDFKVLLHSAMMLGIVASSSMENSAFSVQHSSRSEAKK